jgi:hypothetical protein
VFRLRIAVLGLDILDVDLTTDPPVEEAEEDDPGLALSGGLLVSEHIDAGTTDRYMGFTGGWEGDGDG